jgi:hypothetical protein
VGKNVGKDSVSICLSAGCYRLQFLETLPSHEIIFIMKREIILYVQNKIGMEFIL